MWFVRDFNPKNQEAGALPIKVLKGPRQVGKTSLLEKIPDISVVRLDDYNTRNFVSQNPKLFLDGFSGQLLLDEAPLVPELFPELKRRVDEARRKKENNVNIWLTGSNQTLLRTNVSESLAGRASYFDLNTLSLHELKTFNLREHFFRGGWPELAINKQLNPINYLNDFISTYIEREIMQTAGIEKKSAFVKALALLAARQGMLVNYSEIASLAGVDITTLQSWILILEENGILFRVEPYHNNLNKRLSKTPKIYFHDVALAVRLQGWTEAEPLLLSLQYGFLLETILLTEITRFFYARSQKPKIFHVRTKDQTEVDFLVELDNQRFIAFEVKSNAQYFTAAQNKLLDNLNLNIIAKYVAISDNTIETKSCVAFLDVFELLQGTQDRN